MRTINQCLAGLKLHTQQPRLIAKADVKQYITTHERTEGATADDGKYGDISSTRVDDDPTSLTSFSNSAKHPALTQSSDDTLVDKSS